MTTDNPTPASNEEMASDVTKRTFAYRDEFNRKPIAEKVISLLRADIDISPMVIDGGWGTGKTEFCWKLINMMKEEDTHHVMHINAFQADHANEPLLTVLAEVVKVIPEEEEARSKFTEKILPFLRFSTKTLLKAGAAHILKQDADAIASDFDSAIQDIGNKAIDASVEAILKDHIEADKNLKTLQSALEIIAKDKPIVIFIDELDRCKPDFAIQMLEIIKHIFDVDGVQFVLVCNTEQLKASIQHCYGGEVDAHRYLDKFLKFTFALPKQCLERNQQNDASVRYFKNLVEESEILKPVISIDEDYGIIYLLIQQIINTHNISLREIETMIRYLKIYQIITENEYLGNDTIHIVQLLRITGILLFCFRPKLVEAMRNDKLDAKDLGDFFGENTSGQYTLNSSYAKPYQVVLAILAKECYQNTELFIPINIKEKATMDEDINAYCKELRHYGREGAKPYSQIVINTVKTLSLSGHLC